MTCGVSISQIAPPLPPDPLPADAFFLLSLRDSQYKPLLAAIRSGSALPPTSPGSRYWIQGMQDGVLGESFSDWLVGQTLADVRSRESLARDGTTSGPGGGQFARNIPLVAWFIVASDRVASGFGGAFNARSAGFEVQTLLDRGYITLAEAREMVDTFACLTGETVQLRAVTGQTGEGGQTVESVAVDLNTGAVVEGSGEAETFATDFGTGLDPRTSVITGPDGTTQTVTTAPGSLTAPTDPIVLPGIDPTTEAPVVAAPLVDGSGSPLVPVTTELNRVVEFGPATGAPARPVDQIPADIRDPRDALPWVVSAGKWLFGIALGGGALWALSRSSRKGRR